MLYPDIERPATKPTGVIWTGSGRVARTPLWNIPMIAIEFVVRRDWLRDYVEELPRVPEGGGRRALYCYCFHRNMTVLRHGSDGTSEFIVREHETYKTLLLPGFELPLAQLLAVADRWG